MTDTSIIAAATVAQLSIVAIMFVTTLILAYDGERRVGLLFGFVLFVALATIVTLMFTRGYSSTWGPLFGFGNDRGFERSTTMLTLFLVDIFAVHILVWLTNGSRTSPYHAIYFLLPALAIFLHEPLNHLVWYLLLTTVSYSALMFVKEPTVRSRGPGTWIESAMVSPIGKVAHWFTSVACFVLAIYVGYITRP